MICSNCSRVRLIVSCFRMDPVGEDVGDAGGGGGGLDPLGERCN